MTFRDDREALRERVEALRHALNARDRELAATRRRAEDADQLQHELHEAREVIRLLQGGWPRWWRTVALVGGLLLLVAALVAGVGFVFISAAGGLVDPGSVPY